MGPLQADEIFACLARHNVDYVLIGGLAAVLHGSPLSTVDADICPSLEIGNLERLARALEEMEARIRTPGDAAGVKFPFDASFLRNVQILNLVTRFGDLDLSFRPSGTEGFPDLRLRAVEMSIGEVRLVVSALEDVIRSKEAANRPKDHRALPLLKQLLDEIHKRNRTS